MQRNFNFSASFNAYYLANPNNLLTHTHTHLAHLAFKRLHVRAREARVTPINKGLRRVPFVHIFVSLYEQKMNEIREQVDVHSNKTQHVVGTHGSCVHSPRSKWTSGYAIGADARAVRPYMQCNNQLISLSTRLLVN